MIQEHFCNYENSLDLRELGFDEPTILRYGFDTFQHVLYSNPNGCGMSNDPHDSRLKIPLLSQAIQWIKSSFNIFIDITHSRDLMEVAGEWRYELRLEGKYLTGNGDYVSWNQCAQDAITKALQIIKDERTDIDK